MYHTRKNIPLQPPSLTPHTHAQKHVRRCWIVLTQPTYTDDFYHEPEHSYIAGPYTPLKANRTVAATKTIQNVHKAHPPSRRQPSAPSVSGPSVSGHPSRDHPSRGHPSRRHPSGGHRLGDIRLGGIRLGNIRLRDGEGQDEWQRRMRLKWKAIKRRAHPSWLNISGTSVCAKHLCHPSRRHPSRGHPSQGPPSAPSVSGTSVGAIRLGDIRLGDIRLGPSVSGASFQFRSSKLT